MMTRKSNRWMGSGGRSTITVALGESYYGGSGGGRSEPKLPCPSCGGKIQLRHEGPYHPNLHPVECVDCREQFLYGVDVVTVRGIEQLIPEAEIHDHHRRPAKT